MSIVVTFMTPGDFERGVTTLGIGHCRARETLAVNGTTSAAALDGELALVVSTEAATILGARGTTPDAATAATGASSNAGFPVPPNTLVPVKMNVGDKLNFKALS